MKKELNVYYLDVENSRMIIEFPTYSLYGNDRIDPKYIKKDWAFTCAAWAELDLKNQKIKKIETVSVLDDMKRFKKDNRDDYVIVKRLHILLKDCDVLIGHNLALFDWPKLNYKFAKYGMEAIDAPVIIDTLKAARLYYRSTSNSLYFLAKEFGVEMKDNLPSGVMHAADDGDVKALKRLVAYNKQDIRSGVSLYFKMLPFIKNHPDVRRITNAALASKDAKSMHACQSCGSKEVIKNGYRTTRLGTFQKLLCRSCGSTSITGVRK